MMRADCLVRPMDHPWSNPVVKCEEKEGHNDSGISPGRSSSDAASSSPRSPQPAVYAANTYSSDSPESQTIGGSPQSPPRNGAYNNASPPSPNSRSNAYPNSPAQDNQPDGPLERLKMALERSTALSGIFKKEESSAVGDGQQDSARKEYPCPLCAYSSPYKHRYMEHVATHYADKCTLCDFSAKNANDLRTHLADVHNINDLVDLVDPTDANSDGQDEDDTPGKKNKPKTFKCKQCSFVTNTKLVFWDHTKTHIKAEKLLACPKCPFVTEYKHHLEYHLRNHFGSKPFKCPQCQYSCVNKSMLNSHLKSHSNVYQYRCSDCAYATKYCHSLKLHLRKYGHNPAMVLNADGSPNPLPIIDVYGTRRGPKMRNKNSDGGDDSNHSLEVKDVKQNLPGGIVVPTAPQTSPSHYNYNNNNNVEDGPQTQQSPPKFLYCTFCEFYTVSYPLLADHLNVHAQQSNLSHMFRHNNNIVDHPAVKDYFQNMFLNIDNPPVSPASSQSQYSPQIHQSHRPASPLDLSKHDVSSLKNEDRPLDGKKNRRKGKAYKLERPVDFLEVKMEVPDESFKIKIPEFKPNIKDNSETQPEDYNCGYCDISFKDIVMYTMHMGYHGYQDPFTCNMCGQVTPDKLAFFLHIARSSHS